MKPKETYTLYLQWVESVIDPMQYKPNMPKIAPVKTFIQVEIPCEYVVQQTEDGTTYLTPKGMAYASKQISRAMSKIYEEEFNEEEF